MDSVRRCRLGNMHEVKVAERGARGGVDVDSSSILACYRVSHRTRARPLHDARSRRGVRAEERHAQPGAVQPAQVERSGEEQRARGVVTVRSSTGYSVAWEHGGTKHEH